MKLFDLIKDVEGAVLHGSADVDVRDLTPQAAQVAAGSCFVAIRGEKADGHRYVPEALSRGAVAVVSERAIDVGGGVANVVVADSRHALALMSVALFGDPSRALTLVGVTGTNGKTTTTYLIEAILKHAGRTPGVIGTVEYRFGGVARPAPHTTPESSDLQRLLAEMREHGVDACAMEVSSHALVQRRVAGCHFDAAIFTNLSPEHLDYHPDMESYFAAKALLFEEILAASGKPGAFAAINGDDPYGEALVRRCPVPVVRYGLKAPADIRGVNLRFDAAGLAMWIEGAGEAFACRSRLCGRFNAMNILGAVAVAARLGIANDVIAAAIEGVAVVPGRFEAIENSRGVLAFVDYAHTPDALENVLSHARELAAERLIVVFGCGGDRDRTKRPAMGRAAATAADVVIVTSDNPRTEDPQAIIEEILPGVRGVDPGSARPRQDEVIADRAEAIARAAQLAGPGDVIVVAGKGHERFQLVGSARHPFDDREVLRRALGR